MCNIIRGFIPNFFQGEMKGKVIIDGKNLEEYEMGEIASKIGYVFQNPFNQITGARDTVYGEIAYGLENFGVPVAEIKTRVEKIMEITNTTYLQEKIHLNYLVGSSRELRWHPYWFWNRIF